MFKWYKLLSRADVDLTTIAEVDLAFYYLAAQAGLKNREFLFSFLNKKVLTHYAEMDFKKLGRFAYRKYLNNKPKIIKLYERGKKLLIQTKKESSYWRKQIKANPSFSNLSLVLTDFYRSYKEVSYFYSIIPWWAIEVWQFDFDQLVNQLIKNHHQELNSEKIISSIYSPWKEAAIVKVQKQIAQGVNLKKIAKQYEFLDNWATIWGKPIKLAWFKSLKKINQSQATHLLSLKQLTTILQPNKIAQESLELAPYIVFFKDWRDELRRAHPYYWFFLFDALAKKFKITREELGYLTISELQEALNKKGVNRQIIRTRQAGCIITVDKKGGNKILVGDNTKKYLKIISQVNKPQTLKQISGLIAQKGIVRGRVRIVREPKDIKYVKIGEILVANTTHPEYLPAMQKAAAFITNEGGVISHAAIIAREMKKPCIVGTGNATKILTNGNIVEVDANQGVVKIVNN